MSDLAKDNNSTYEILCTGLLVKSPPMEHQGFIKRRWRERYFCLYRVRSTNQYFLDYYKHEHSNKRKGRVDLDNCSNLISNVEFEKWYNVFSLKTLHKSRERQYYFCASSPFEMENWVQLLCKACCMIPTEEQVRRSEMLMNPTVPRNSRHPNQDGVFGTVPRTLSNINAPTTSTPRNHPPRGLSGPDPSRHLDSRITSRSPYIPRQTVPRMPTTGFSTSIPLTPRNNAPIGSIFEEKRPETLTPPVAQTPNQDPVYYNETNRREDAYLLYTNEDDYIIKPSGDIYYASKNENPPKAFRALPDPNKPPTLPPPRKNPLASTGDQSVYNQPELAKDSLDDVYFVQPSEGSTKTYPNEDSCYIGASEVSSSINSNEDAYCTNPLEGAAGRVDMRRDETPNSNQHDSLNISNAKMYRRSTICSEIKSDSRKIHHQREQVPSESSASSEDLCEGDDDSNRQFEDNSGRSTIIADNPESLGLREPYSPLG